MFQSDQTTQYSWVAFSKGGGEGRIGAAVTLCSRVTRPPSVPEWPRIGVDDVRIAGSLHWGTSYTSSGMPTQGPSGPTMMWQYLYIAVHTGSAKVKMSRGEFREKQENKGSLDSVQQATQASGHWDPSDYKSEEQQKGRQVVLLILLGLLCTDHICTCLVWLR